MPLEDGEWDDQIGHHTLPGEAANLGSTSPGPEVESPEVPAWDIEDDSLVTEPHPETQTESSGAQGDPSEEDEPLPEFDPKIRQDFEGLLYLGRLTDEFSWLGHRFVIRTLTAGEVLEVGLLHKRYVGSVADVKAYQAAVVAACVVEVDGQPMPVPLTNSPTDTELVNRFNYVLRSWFPPTLDAVYERYLLLEARVREVIDAMGKVPGSTESTSTLSGTSV